MRKYPLLHLLLFIAGFLTFALQGEVSYNKFGKTEFKFDGQTIVGAGNLIVGIKGTNGGIQWFNEDSIPSHKEYRSGKWQIREQRNGKTIDFYKQSICNISAMESLITYEFKLPAGLKLTHFIFRICLPGQVLNVPQKSPDIKPVNGCFSLKGLAGNVSVNTAGSTAPVVLRDYRHLPDDKRGYLWFFPKYDPRKGAEMKIALHIKASISQNSLHYVSLPLQKIANRCYADDGIPGNKKGGWTDQGINDLAFLKPGRITSAGIPFELCGKAVILRGKENLTSFPSASEKLPLNGIKAERIDFLHSVAWGEAKGTTAFSYELIYADGKKEIIPVRSMSDVADWRGDTIVPNARIAVSGMNGEGKVSLYHMMWNNPRPHISLKSFRILKNTSGSVPIVLAVTIMRTGTFPDDVRRGLISLFNVPQIRKSVSTKDWYPCPIAWENSIENGSALDISFLNDAPAGKLGHVIVNSEGKFAFSGAPDKAVRFWGTNLGAAALFPDKKMADSITANLAKQGVNLVRMHAVATKYHSYLGRHWLLKKDGSLDRESLDRFHYLISACRRNGIYVYMDCNDGLWYEALLQRPLREDERLAAQFNPELIAATKKFLTALLGTKNPYTGLSIAEDPAVAMFELINESSLPGMVRSDMKKRLGRFYTELNSRFEEWKKNNAPHCAGELAAGNDADRIRFLTEVQQKHFDDMYGFLRKLGVKSPICGNNNLWVPADLTVAEKMDFTSEHFYIGFSSYGNQRAIPQNNECLVRTPAKGYPMSRRLNDFKLKGKPIVAGEWNFCFPNDFRSEGLPLCTAYSLLQSHDALLFFCATGSFDCGLWERFKKNPGIFPHSQQTDPSTWGLSQACALAFRRGDIAPAKKVLRIHCSPEWLYSTTDLNELTSNRYSGIAAIHRLENVISSEKNTPADWSRYIRNIPDDYVQSDTGELRRFPLDGLFLVDTPCTKMAVGALNKLDSKKRKLKGVSISSTSEFGTLTLTSLDGKPIQNSRRILLCLVGNSRNKDTIIENQIMKNWGTSGTVITEPLNAEISIRRGEGAFTVYKLDTLTGKRLEKVPVKSGKKMDRFQITKSTGTIYFELSRGEEKKMRWSELISSGTVFRDGMHNAFPSVCRFKDDLYIAFRSGMGHLFIDGKIKVMRSRDEGKNWEAVKTFSAGDYDLRDPRLVVFNGKLHLYSGMCHADRSRDEFLKMRHWVSADGEEFKEVPPAGFLKNTYAWGFAVQDGEIICGAYESNLNMAALRASLYRSPDGVNWKHDTFLEGVGGNEVALDFDGAGILHGVIRRELPPFFPLYFTRTAEGKIQYREIPVPMKGIMVKCVGDDFLIAARRWDEKYYESLRCDYFRYTRQGNLTKLGGLPSAGDCSYAANVELKDGSLLLVYYSSHHHWAKRGEMKDPEHGLPADICFAVLK